MANTYIIDEVHYLHEVLYIPFNINYYRYKTNANLFPLPFPLLLQPHQSSNMHQKLSWEGSLLKVPCIIRR